MRFDFALMAVSLFSTAAAGVIDGPRNVQRLDTAALQDEQDLYKRRGGGGGGGRGGGGGSSGGGGGSSGGGRGGGSGSSGGGSGGSGSSGGSSGSRPGNTSPKSNTGGTSRGGTGPAPSFGGGRFYGGGSSRPYPTGGISPAGIVPFLLVGSALAFWPGLWLYGANMYPYHHVHQYHNATSNTNETAKVLCACAEYAECGCDENNSTAYYNDLLGNGSYQALNKTVVNVGTYEGSNTIFINGTLPNGTTADGPSNGSAGLGMRSLVEAAGIWPAVATLLAAVFLA